ncbi:hypothetical protein [Yoonia sp.]|nr:hypothetical protein [Yoonia sp.]
MRALAGSQAGAGEDVQPVLDDPSVVQAAIIMEMLKVGDDP